MRKGIRCFGDPREVNLKRGAEPWFTVNPDVATALAHDSVNRRQAKSGAAAFFFGGEKRFEDAADGFAVHATAAVGDAQLHVRAGANVNVLVGIRFAELDVGRFHFQAAARRHGVASVGHKVQHDLGQMAAVDFDAAYLPAELHFKVDAFANDSNQKRLQVLKNGVQVQDLRLKNLLTAEGEQLASHRGGFFAGHFDFLDALGCGFVQRCGAQEQLAVAEDYAEKIVEIVRNTAGQAANGFHFLSLDELLLEGIGTLLFFIALPLGQFAARDLRL